MGQALVKANQYEWVGFDADPMHPTFFINFFTMRQKISLTLLITATLAGFTGYWLVLLNWGQALKTGQYETHPVGVSLETVALVVYTGLALRFLIDKLGWK